MAHWLVIAISIFWGIHACYVATLIIDYGLMTPRQRRLTEYTALGKALSTLIIPFTIFWWSWMIFG